jgi:hypothetical protein
MTADTKDMPLYNFPEVEGAFLEGDRSLILKAIYWSATTGSPLPHWVCKAFAQAYAETIDGEHASWDDVFGAPHDKGTKLSAKNSKIRLLWPVYIDVLTLREKTRLAKKRRTNPIPQVAERYGIGARVCKDYYLEADKEARASELGKRFGLVGRIAYGHNALKVSALFQEFLESRGLKPIGRELLK